MRYSVFRWLPVCRFISGKFQLLYCQLLIFSWRALLATSFCQGFLSTFPVRRYANRGKTTNKPVSRSPNPAQNFIRAIWSSPSACFSWMSNVLDEFLAFYLINLILRVKDVLISLRNYEALNGAIKFQTALIDGHTIRRKPRLEEIWFKRFPLYLPPPICTTRSYFTILDCMNLR